MASLFESLFSAFAKPVIDNIHVRQDSVTLISPTGTETIVDAMIGEIETTKELDTSAEFEQETVQERRRVRISPNSSVTLYYRVKIETDTVYYAIDSIDAQSDAYWTLNCKRIRPLRERRAQLER